STPRARARRRETRAAARAGSVPSARRASGSRGCRRPSRAPRRSARRRGGPGATRRRALQPYSFSCATGRPRRPRSRAGTPPRDPGRRGPRSAPCAGNRGRRRSTRSAPTARGRAGRCTAPPRRARSHEVGTGALLEVVAEVAAPLDEGPEEPAHEEREIPHVAMEGARAGGPGRGRAEPQHLDHALEARPTGRAQAVEAVRARELGEYLGEVGGHGVVADAELGAGAAREREEEAQQRRTAA